MANCHFPSFTHFFKLAHNRFSNEVKPINPMEIRWFRTSGVSEERLWLKKTLENANTYHNFHYNCIHTDDILEDWPERDMDFNDQRADFKSFFAQCDQHWNQFVWYSLCDCEKKFVEFSLFCHTLIHLKSKRNS